MKARNFGVGFVAAAALVFAASLANAYNIPVVNGDFQLQSLPAGYVTPNTDAIPAWDKSNPSVGSVWNLDGWGPGAAFPKQNYWNASAITNQNQVAILDGFNSISQIVRDPSNSLQNLKIQSGWTYELSALVGTPALPGGSPSGYGIGLFVGSVPLDLSFGAAPTRDFSEVDLSYTATANDAGKDLRIVLMSFGNPVAFDNVKLTSTAVPEPSTLLGLGSLGLMGLVFATRRWWKRG